MTAPPITAGERSTRVTIQSQTRTPTATGGWTTTWAPIAGASSGQFWAKVEQVEGGEQTVGAQTLPLNVYEVTLLKKALAGASVTIAMRVVWPARGKTLSVFQVNDAHRDKSRLVLRCREEPTA